MIAPLSLRLATLGILSVFLFGCATQSPQARISKNQDLFDSYPAEVQTAIEEGRVEPGFDADQVRMAIGDPSRVETRRTEDSEQTVYVYTRSSPGLSFGVGGSRGGGSSSIGTGVGISTGGRSQDVLRVVFEGGKVKAVEEIQ
ncbi:MAG: hypothetical protein JJU20_02315 [Opitutales bacterium]|nr:hypothetical protein [Opitutales bacterium]